jgi:hypothetical protein
MRVGLEANSYHHYASWTIICSIVELKKKQYSHVYGGTRDDMTGSSSDDWILLAVRLQPLLITLNHNTIADSTHFTIILHTDLLCPNMHSQFTAIAPSRIALVPICFPTRAHLKVFTDRSLPAAISHRQLNYSKSQLN